MQPRKATNAPRREKPSKNTYENFEPLSLCSGMGMAGVAHMAVNIPTEREHGETILSGGSDCRLIEPNKISRVVIRAIQEQNIPKLKEILSEYPMLHLYRHVDPSGSSTLEWAVAVSSIEILSILIEKSPYLDERLDMIVHALKIAVTHDKLDIVQYLLHRKNIETDEKLSENASLPKKASKGRADDKARTPRRQVMRTLAEGARSMFEDARFSDSVCPVILAAQLNRHEILQLLLGNGETDIHPLTAPCVNPVECTMYSCNSTPVSLFTLQESHALLQKYRALSSPSFLLNSGIQDPIAEAFQITVDMDTLSQEDPAFKHEYQEIAQKVRTFIWEFTGLCRTSQEVDVLIHEEAREDTALCCGGHLPQNRIQMAVSLKQIEFLTHPNIQKFLQKAWYEGCPAFVSRNIRGMKRILLSILFFLCYPILATAYMLNLSRRVHRLMNAGVLKFLAHVISYMIFITLLFINGIYWHQTDHDQTPVTLHVIACWVLGMALSYCRQICVRLRASFRCASAIQVYEDWRIYDGAVIVVFIVSITGHYMYTLDAISKHALQVACAFYAMGCLLAILRVCTFMNESNIFGPLYISLKRVALDTCKFGILVFIFIFANVVTVMHLAGSSSECPPSEPEADGTTLRPENLSNAELYVRHHGVGPKTTDCGGLRTNTAVLVYFWKYFWVLFGEGDNIQHNTIFGSHMKADESPVATQLIPVMSNIILSLYFISVPLVLLNMLIAMMANSYTRIEVNSDSEWKFARSRLRMSYIYDVSVLPPPLNLVPITYVLQLGAFLVGRCKCVTRKERQTQRRASPFDFQALMMRLRKRYWSKQDSIIAQAPTNKRAISTFSM